MKYFVAIKSKEDCSEALAAARRYSPNIEIVDETTLVFDITGSKAKEVPRIARELRERFEAVAVSENLAAALLLARWGRKEFKFQSSNFKVCDAAAEAKESKSSKQTLNLPPDDELFKIKKSEYPAGPLITSGEEFNARADKDRRRKASRFRVQEEEFKVQSSKFKVRNVEVEAKEAGSGQQTLNLEHGTLNAPKALTWNLELETWNLHLSALPIDAISPKQEFLELMDSWAIHDLGSFSQLPEDGMVERFGPEIVELRKQAAGQAFRAPNWNVKDDKFFWAKELEGAIETIEPLNFVLSKGVEQIFRNLAYAALSTQSAKITLRGRKKEKTYRIRIVFPTRNQKLWIRQIVTKIELDSPQFNIDRVEIEFRSTKPRTVQNNLYSGVILEPENLNLIVTKLKKVVGLSKIGLPKLRDSWSEQFYMTEDLSPLIRDTGTRGQGDAGSGCAGVRERAGEREGACSGEQTLNPEPKTHSGLSTQASALSTQHSVPSTQYSALSTVFYYFPQPVKARVFFESGEPKALIIKGKRELVRMSGGPWRKDAEWYRTKKWQRDEWDIETETGAVYRVFTDKNGEAFVDGGYD